MLPNGVFLPNTIQHVTAEIQVLSFTILTLDDQPNSIYSINSYAEMDKHQTNKIVVDFEKYTIH
jgi:hypothetical protein